MKARFRLIMTAVSLSVAVLGACVLTPHAPEGYTLGIGPPGGIYNLGDTIHLNSFMSAYPDTPSITEMRFYADGSYIGSASSIWQVPWFPEHVLGSELYWTPAAAGVYQVQSQALLTGGGTAVSKVNRICVLDMANPTGLSDSYGYLGPCPMLPPLASINPSDSSVSLTVQATLGTFAPQLGIPASNCAGPTITFTASVRDPAHRVALVLVRYDAQNGAGGGGNSLALNEVPGASLIDRTFLGSTAADVAGAMQGKLVDRRGNAIEGSLVWSGHALDSKGEEVATTGPQTIVLAGCAGTITPSPIPPSPTNTPASTPTSTATSAPTETATLTATPIICPRGTILDPQRNACVYASRTPKPTRPAGDCSSFGSASACTSSGCSWDKLTGTCH